MDQDLGQMDIAKCIRHPQMVIGFMYCKENCPYSSRMACNKCLKEYNTIEGFEDILDVLKDPKVIINSNDRPQSSYNAICKYFNILEKYSEEVHLFVLNKLINSLQIDILKQIQKLEQDLKDGIQQYNKFREEILKAKQQFLDATGHQEIRQKFREILLVENYHQSEEWSKLEEKVSNFVLKFENEKNQELMATCTQLQEMQQTFFNPQLFNNSTSTLSKNISTLCNFKEMINFPRFTTLCDQLFFFNLLQRISKNSIILPKIKRIFKATEQGFNSYAFWKNCSNEGKTIIICQSQSGHVFGGYTPLKWIADNRSAQNKDDNYTSFLFSYTRDEIYPEKQDQNCWEQSHLSPEYKYTIYCGANQGPQFGKFDLIIHSDFKKGSSTIGSYYSTGQYNIKNSNTHLMGGEQPNLVEMEVFQIY